MSFEPQNWPLVKLSDLITVKHGFAFKGEFFSDEPTELQLTTPGNFAIGGGFQLGKGKFYSGEYPTEYVLKNGDLIVTMTDLSKAADTLGYAAIVPETEGTIWLHNQRVGLVQIKKDAPVALDFLHYLMRTADYRHWVVSTATGSTVKHTSPSRICDYEFRLPPIWLQGEIGRILTAHDDRIALLRETNATLEAIAQALFKSWFVDFDPVHANAGTQTPSLPPEIQALFPATFTDSPQGPIPQGWKVGTVGDVIETLGGATPDTKNEEFWYPAEIAWTSPKDLSGLKTPVLLATERRISQKGLTKISSGLLPKGTLLMSSRAPIGYLAIAQIPLAINQGYIAMPPGGYFPPLYMLFWCRTNMELIENRANGSTFMEISKKAFKPIELIVPPIEIIDQFMSNATPLFEKLIENEQQAQNLESLRDTLLPRLISGQLRLPDTDQFVAAITD